MVTTLLLKQLTIFFIYMAAGFMMVKLGILKGEDSKVLSLLCIYVLLPCAILKSYQAEYTPELRDGFMLAMGAAVAAQLILMVSAGFATWMPRKKHRLCTRTARI